MNVVVWHMRGNLSSEGTLSPVSDFCTCMYVGMVGMGMKGLNGCPSAQWSMAAFTFDIWAWQQPNRQGMSSTGRQQEVLDQVRAGTVLACPVLGPTGGLKRAAPAGPSVLTLQLMCNRMA